jgi:hypothetical protein
MKCVNEDCNKKVCGGVLASVDGDFACDNKCLSEYEKQKYRFFNEIVGDDVKFDEWMNSK